MFDIIIIGAGIIGTQMAYTLSLTSLSVLVLEKNAEILNEVSSSNSGIIHTGYDPDEHTLKAKLNVRGAYLYRELCAKLEVPLMECGSMIVAHNEKEIQKLLALKVKADRRSIPCKMLNQNELRLEEPHIADSVIQALLFPTTAAILPWQMGYALIDNACQNGVQLHTSEPVLKVERGSCFTVTTQKQSYQAKMVINCSGLNGDKVARLEDPDYPIHLLYKRGEYQVTDKSDASYINHILFPLPTDHGKGVLAVKTVEGNLLFGPNNHLVDDPYDGSCTIEGLNEIDAKIGEVIKPLPKSRMIRQFAGVRPSSPTNDFIIEDHNHWINVIGIDSPGLASSPAIAEYVYETFVKPVFNPIMIDREVYIHPKPLSEMSIDHRNQLVKKNPSYGQIVCLCEDVSLQEVIDAIHSPAQTKSVKGIKRRTRPGSGRCQGGFCEAKIVELLSKELNIPRQEVLYDNDQTQFLIPMEDLYEKK
ncbi:MAG: glycerol-3-phosphate dehydrogenase [Erysipelotrichaceae bacterium]|nr:MAG: glycerol-3-phosphate [Erysipelotrichaceae bacterium]TXT16725.1 MAG: glycerol-3-phosphate dehydrogenase [Erysipelotrichaceae bacterium]